MPENTLEDFRQIVLADERLQEQLRDLTDRNDFIERLIAMGRERGFEFTFPEVEDALRMARSTAIDRAI